MHEALSVFNALEAARRCAV